MKTFALVSAVSALMIAGTVAYAQPTPPPAGGPGGPGARAPMDRADFDSLTDARIAAIQAGLKLTATQQPLWAPVEQALRANAAERAERREQRRERGASATRPDFMQRLEQRSEFASKNAARSTDLTAAMKPLWASLDERQKRLLPVLMRADAGQRWHRGGAHRGHGMRQGMGGHGMGGHGMGGQGMGGQGMGGQGMGGQGMGGGMRGGMNQGQEAPSPQQPTPAPQ